MPVNIVTLALLAIHGDASQAKSDVAQPFSDWEVIKASEAVCSASRVFGSGNYAISINNPILSDNYFIKFIQKRPIRIRQGDQVRIQILPQGTEVIGGADGFPPIGDRQNLFGLYAEKGKLKVSNLELMNVYVNGKKISAINTSGMADAIEQLDSCSNGLMSQYGIDVEKAKLVAVQPKSLIPIINIIGPDNYPTSALKNREEGRVGIKFKVNKIGKVDSCKVVLSSGNPVLDEGTCNVIKNKGIYKPAKDKYGKSIDADQLMFINWTIPK